MIPCTTITIVEDSPTPVDNTNMILFGTGVLVLGILLFKMKK